MKYYYDLHMHSCLSPCGSDDMTPNNLVNMAKLAGYDIIALTDHNSSLNCPAAVKAGKQAGVTVVPGMELCSSEEVHIVCLFPKVENALDFSEYVSERMMKVPYSVEIFGNQHIMDENDRITGTVENLLNVAADISANKAAKLVSDFGGVCFPAHIDRPSFSIISNLGMITGDMGFVNAELTAMADPEEYSLKYPILKKMRLLTDSDAHYLENIPDALRTLELEECSAECLIDLLRQPPEI